MDKRSTLRIKYFSKLVFQINTLTQSVMNSIGQPTYEILTINSFMVYSIYNLHPFSHIQ